MRKKYSPAVGSQFASFPGGASGAEIEADPAIFVHLEGRLVVGIQACPTLRVGNHRFGLHAIGDNGPEVARGHVCRHPKPIGMLSDRRSPLLLRKTVG